MPTIFRVLAATALVAASVAWARNTITTPAGCNSEFGSGSGQAKACIACVKGGGKYRAHVKNKGAWTCE